MKKHASDDPFRHHPGLRDLIRNPLESPFRDFDIDEILKAHPNPFAEKFKLPREEREAGRRRTLDARPRGDFWVFAYGSLMWDPAFRFADVRRARAPGFARRFILRDVYGARGTPDAPGLMAALDTGAGCDGLVFRISPDLVEEESKHIWARERAGNAYLEAFIEVELSDSVVSALTFVADHDAHAIQGDMSRDEQVKYLATGTGFIGTSLEYIENLAIQFETLGIEDPEVTGLLGAARAFQAQTSV